MNHPIPKNRRRYLATHRQACRLLGKHVTGRISHLFRRFHREQRGTKTYYVVNTNPLVIYIGHSMRHVFDMSELLAAENAHFIKNSYHTYENSDRLERLQQQHEAFCKFYPQHSIEYICPTTTETKMFKEYDIQPATFLNKNAFIDETQYQVIPSTKKQFNAVYNAQLSPYKRHHLAAAVQELSLIVYRHPSQPLTPEKIAYESSVREGLRHAVWLNDLDKFIPPSEIAAVLNQSKVGLCLSAEEGPMAACVEYLLCGLPVVSTKSLGGRDVFLEPDYSRLVEDSPEAVSEAVAELIRDAPPAQEIRNRCLEKMATHRAAFIDLVESAVTQMGGEGGFQNRFPELFINKLRIAAPFPDAFLKHCVTGMPVDLCKRLASTQNN